MSLPDSSALNLSSMDAGADEPPVSLSWRVVSAWASSVSTLSFMRSKAATAELVPTSDSMSFTLVVALAVRARAVYWSFLSFASVILASSSFMASYRPWMEPSCWLSCAARLCARSSCPRRRSSASRASSSSPFSSASCARLYHLPASSSAARICSLARFCEAMTSAYDWRIFTRSFCMSTTACSSTFSGSSALAISWLTFALTSREKRSRMFIDTAEVAAGLRETKADAGRGAVQRVAAMLVTVRVANASASATRRRFM
mmetsp:Transcript_5616/g.14346  ORF Transcript_5616/g.14346 Transcript_5616/m.14346 type:complete len:260 (+) Transcript_5616:178-957(+)